MGIFRKDRDAPVRQVLEAIIVLMDKKKIIRKDEIQLQILENAGEVREIDVGGIKYKVDKEDLDE